MNLSSKTFWAWLKGVKSDVPEWVLSLVKQYVGQFLRSQVKDFRKYLGLRKLPTMLQAFPWHRDQEYWEYVLAAWFVCTHGTPTEAAVRAFLQGHYGENPLNDLAAAEDPTD